MAKSDVHYLNLTEISAKIAAREVSPVEVTKAILSRIARAGKKLNAYAHLLADSALAQAKQAETEIARGRHRGPLHGVPIAVKDLCFTKGVPTGCGTTMLAKWKPKYSATVVERFEMAGAVLLGKLQMTEGAFADHHPKIKAPVNPWHADHWPGASSSGSGSATAAGLCYGSLGSDTGGSIRFPSTANGVTGLKPTWGRVSRYGVFPLSETMDHIGPMARSAADAAAILGVIAGADPNDPTALRAPVPDYLAGLAGGVRGLRIGVDRTFNGEGVDNTVVKSVDGAVDVLRRLGAEIKDVTVPSTTDVLTGWLNFCAVETAVAHEATYPSRADQYGPALAGLIEAGRALSGMDLTKILLDRQAFNGRLAAVFEDVELIVFPAMFMRVPSLKQMATLGEDPDALFNLLRYTAPLDTSGSPTITMPCGFDRKGLPIGFQLIGRHLSEDLLCRAGHAYQQATDWHTRHPAI